MPVTLPRPIPFLENMMFFDERIIPPGYREIKLRPTSFEAKNK